MRHLLLFTFAPNNSTKCASTWSFTYTNQSSDLTGAALVLSHLQHPVGHRLAHARRDVRLHPLEGAGKEFNKELGEKMSIQELKSWN